MNIPVRRGGGVEPAEDVVPRTTAAWARSRAAARASGVLAIGAGISGCGVGDSWDRGERSVVLDVGGGWDWDA
jgi:hypothetical protein